jgi:predicted transcriptional regulator
MNNSEWITIREACEISKKPEVTIRRLVKRLVNDNLKTGQNVKIDKSGGANKYLLKREYILVIYDLKENLNVTTQQTSQDKSDDISHDKSDINHELINLLKQELIEKNKQIEKLQDTLKNQQVLNLEMTRYLDKMALPVVESVKKDDVVDKSVDKDEEPKTKKRWWF